MATSTPTPAAAGSQRDVVVSGRDANQQAPEPEKITNDTVIPGGDVTGFRVGSEAAVESGLEPVMPVGAAAVSEATKVRNKDLRARDEREWKRRGVAGPSVAVAGRTVSFSTEGLVVVERIDENGDEGQKTTHSGGGTFPLGAGLVIRPLTDEEQAQMFGPSRPENARRASDVVAGSGTGGGGNPMIRGETRGTSSVAGPKTGTGNPSGTTSASGPSPASQSQGPGGTAAPQGGGTTSRTGR